MSESTPEEVQTLENEDGVDTGDVDQVEVDKQLDSDEPNAERGGLGDTGADDVSDVEDGEVVELENLPEEEAPAEESQAS